MFSSYRKVAIRVGGYAGIQAPDGQYAPNIRGRWYPGPNFPRASLTVPRGRHGAVISGNPSAEHGLSAPSLEHRGAERMNIAITTCVVFLGIAVCF